MRKKLIIIVFAIMANTCFAQKIKPLQLDSLKDSEVRLSGLSEQMVRSTDEMTRIVSGKNFIRQMARTLKVEGSYYYKFDSLKAVSIIRAPDDLFRIFTWNVATDDEHFRYFGVIQMNPEKIKKAMKYGTAKPFYPLIDRSDSVQTIFYSELDPNHWVGANYYQIIKTSNQKGTYYTLLGWDGATKLSNKKIIDVLWFRDDMPVFGAPIFNIKTKRPLYRMIWEFNNEATMTLRFEAKRKILVFENIIPPNAKSTGMYQTYVPDGSYDYMIWKNGEWQKQSDILINFKMN